MPIFLPLKSAIDLTGESASTVNCASASWVPKKILIGRPSAAMLSAPAALAPIAMSIALDTIARVGALTSANFTYSTSRPSFSRNRPCSSTDPNPRLTPLVQYPILIFCAAAGEMARAIAMAAIAARVHKLRLIADLLQQKNRDCARCMPQQQECPDSPAPHHHSRFTRERRSLGLR